MPKKVKYSRLKTRIRRGKSGQVWVYYFFDMRPEGEKDIPLGSDLDEALRKWAELTETGAMKRGRLAEAFDRWEKEELPKYDSAETRKGYAKNLKRIGPVFRGMCWDEVDLPTLRQYLDLRTAKTQGNREMSLLSLIWSRAIIWGMTRLVWPAAGVKSWKNIEQAREFEVTPELFAAVYAQGDQVLRDCMDIASATAMRLTDARAVRLPVNGVITMRANKSRKRAEFVVADSPVLASICERRHAQLGECVMLLATPAGKPVSAYMLRERWDRARSKAVEKATQQKDTELAEQIQQMWLRDMRSFAADLATDIDAASKLLQHSSKAITQRHYRTKAERLQAVR